MEKNSLQQKRGELKKLVIKGNGRIHITVAIDIAPFFVDNIEDQFFRIRNHSEYNGFIAEPWPESEYCKYDSAERDLEKDGYDIGVFRGIIYNDFFTPIYKVKPELLKKLLEKQKGEIKEHFKEDKGRQVLHASIIKNLSEIITGCNIWLKLSKAGIGYMFFEKEIEKGKEIGDYSEAVREILATPYPDTEEKEKKIEIEKMQALLEELGLEDTAEKLFKEIKDIRTQKGEQVFNSYLWALAIYSTYFFLKEYEEKIKEKLDEIIEVKEDILKPHPFEVKYGKTTFTKDSPPLRNYLIAYAFPNDIEGKIIDDGGEEKTLNFKDEYKECSYPDFKDCKEPFQTKKICFLKDFGSLLLSLLEGAFIKESDSEDSGKGVVFNPPPIKLSKSNEIPLFDLSSWDGELCLLESEGMVVIYSPKKINVAGKDLKYDQYWRCIIKGLGFMTGGKTLAQVIHRMLIDCTMHYRKVWEEKEKERETEVIERKISTASNLLSKDRIALSPSMIARAPYARKKFERFLKVTGIKGLLHDIEVTFKELNEAVTHYGDRRRQDMMQRLTTISIPLATVIAGGTVMLAIDTLGFSDKVISYVGCGTVLLVISELIYLGRWEVLQRKVKKDK